MTIVQILGGAIAGMVALQLLAALFFYIRRERVSVRLLQQQISTARQRAEEAQLERARKRDLDELRWDGCRKFRVVRKEFENDVRSICSFYLEPHDGKPLPWYYPGQYLTFEFDIRTPQARTARSTIRCYSLSDKPDRNQYRISVKRITSSPGQPDESPGLVSSYLHDHVEEGSIVDVKAPSGHFFLDPVREAPVVLVGGGVGITPVLSMLNTIIERGSQQEVWFFYGVTNSDEQIMRQHLEQVAMENENIHLNICFSQPLPTDEEGRDFHHGERISAELLKRLLPSNNFQFYICGPSSMMTSLTRGMEEWGVPQEAVHYEAFGPASIKKKKSEESPSAVEEKVQLPQVTFSRSGKTCQWNPAAGSLLEFAEEQGLSIDSGCRVGNCQTCLTAIRQGEVDYLNEPDGSLGKGTCLTCISVPRGDIVLDA